MPKPPPIIAAVLAGLALSGCASPGTTAKPATTGLTTPAAHQTAIGAPRPCDQRQLQDLLAELRQSGSIDPATEEQLTQDLQQSDPSLWPLVVEQYRATQAYQRQAMRRSGGLGYGGSAKGDSPIFAETKIGTVPAKIGTVPAKIGTVPQRLPPTDGVALAPVAVPQDAYPSTSAPADEVTQASYTQPGDWRQRLNDAIDALEAETPPTATTPAEQAGHARLRLLYAAAGRREEAAKPIPDVPPATQQFLSKELEGLGIWLDAERVPDPIRRAAEAKPALTEALARLGETAPLMVRNAAFCREALGFGSIKRFDKYEFFQNQEVLLYAELENFVSEPTDKGFRTSLRSGYQILDHLGQQVVWHEFVPTQDYCKTPRRDFFIAYRLRLPKQMALGKYTLRLLVQDATRQKTGQASIEFTVKEGKAESEKGKGEKEQKTKSVAAYNQCGDSASV
jgi:hypothetical protein